MNKTEFIKSITPLIPKNNDIHILTTKDKNCTQHIIISLTINNKIIAAYDLQYSILYVFDSSTPIFRARINKFIKENKPQHVYKCYIDPAGTIIGHRTPSPHYEIIDIEKQRQLLKTDYKEWFKYYLF